MKHFNLPDLGEGLQEAQILKWHVQIGDGLYADQLLVSVETAKAVVDIPAPYAGLVEKLHGEPGDILSVGAPLLSYSAESEADAVVGRLKATDLFQNEEFYVGASPSTREFIEADTVVPNLRPRACELFSGGEVLQGVRRSMALNMEKSYSSVVPVSIFGDADLYRWDQARDPLMRLIKAVAVACTLQPALNCWFDRQTMSIKRHEHVDLGIAVDTPAGLFVPVLRDVGRRPVAELKRNLALLRSQIKTRSIKPAELNGATLTLSNFGALSCRYATPIVVPPQVAIIGAGGVREEAVVMNGKVRVHPVLPLSLTFDHRAVTGREATDFIQAVITELESWHCSEN